MNLNIFWEYLLSIILPKGQNVSLIENMTEEEIVRDIELSDEIIDEKYKALFQYKNKIARNAIWEIKYRGNKKIVSRFSKLLYEFIINEVSDEISFSNFNNPLLVPIPKSKASLREKGFNQSELIVKEISRIDESKNFEMSLDSLRKIKETAQQSKLKNRAERLKNLIGCFSADSEKVRGRCVILIDDVITTGATMKEASKTLREAGAKKVLGFAISH